MRGKGRNGEVKFAWKERRILRKEEEEEGRDENDEIFKLCVGIIL